MRSKFLLKTLSLLLVTFLARGSIVQLSDHDTVDEMHALSIGSSVANHVSGAEVNLIPIETKVRIGATILENMTEDQGQISLRRSLALGDFATFNELFKDAIIRLPDADITERLVFQLTLRIRKLRCFNIAVGDIIITYDKVSNSRLTYKIDIVDLDLDCDMDYSYKYGLVKGDGRCKAFTDNNSASVQLAFASTDFDQAPPSSVNVESCTADINVSNFQFSGDWIGSILDRFEGIIRGTVEGEVQDVACDELSSLGSGFIQDFLDLAADTLLPYLEPLPLGATDPLAAEKALLAANVPENVNLLNFRNTEDVIGQWFDTILGEADTLLGDMQDDAGGPTGTGKDLGFNIFLRDYVLDEDRAFNVRTSDLPIDFDGVLYKGHDKLTETTISLDAVKIFGLDTLTRFEPLLSIGNYTLENELTWSFITIELDLTIDIKPSTRNDSILENPGDVHIIEKVNIDFGVDNVAATVALMLAVDQTALGSLKIGPLLDTATLPSCLLSSLFDVELSGLDVSIGNVRNPTLDGFLSPGIDRVVSRTVDAVFLMYETLLLKSAPSIFQTTLRDIINKNVLKNYVSDEDNKECPLLEFGEEKIDLRDLFLEPDQAAVAGGSGKNPYGNVASSLMTLLQNQITAIDDDSLPKINSLMIRSLTESQSGTEGSIVFSSELIGFAKDDIPFLQSVQLSLFNTRIHNLDTITAPLSVLQPSNTPHKLNNIINVGPVAGKPLNGTVRVLISLDGGDETGSSPLSMINVLDISAAVSSSIISTDILAMMEANGLMQFPLRDILNQHCWLSLFDASELDEDGMRVDRNAETSLGLQNFVLSMAKASLEVKCLSCSSLGTRVLPDVVALLDQTGSVSTLRRRAAFFANELVNGELVQTLLDRLVHSAPMMCPHRPEFKEGAVAPDYGPPPFPTMSRQSLETVVYAASLGLDAAIVVISDSHSDYDASTRDFLSGQKGLKVPDGVQLVDLTNLGGSLGTWVDSAIKEANSYLSGPVDDIGGPKGDSDMGINVALREFVLDSSRVLSVELEELELSGGETRVALTNIRVKGLDTFTTFSALEIVAAQTVRNEFGWELLNIEVDVSIETASSPAETLTLSVELRSVKAFASLLLAMDVDLLGSLELGSLMRLNQILPCILSASHAIEVTELVLEAEEMEWPSLDGFLSGNLKSAADGFSQAIQAKYGDLLKESLPGIMDQTVRGLLNNWIDHYISLESSVACPPLDLSASLSDFMDFRDLFLKPVRSMELGGSGMEQYGDLFRSVRDLLTDQVLAIDEDGRSAVNDLIVGPLTDGSSGEPGTLVYEGDLLDTSARVSVGGLDARVELKVYNASIRNLDSVGAPLSLLDPLLNLPSELNNTATIGVGPDPLFLSANILIALEDDGDIQILNEVEVTVDLTKATVILGALLQIAESPFVSFPMRDFLNVNCWLATIPAPILDSRGIRVSESERTASVSELAVSIANIGLKIRCIECSGPAMEEMVELVSSPESEEDVNEVASNILEYATKLLDGDFLQVQIDRLLVEAPKKCPHREEYEVNPAKPTYDPFEMMKGEGDSVEFLIALVVLGLCMVASFLIIRFLIRWLVRRRHRKWVASLPGQGVALIHRQQTNESEKEAELNRLTTSMFLSKTIPVYARWLIPVIILSNIGLFLSGHLSLGAEVRIRGELAGQEFSVDDFFSFSMANSVVQIWNAGGKELAVLLLLLSGVWPYLKQLITLFLWFLPPQRVSVSRRESIFLWLDALAKWSMMDVFVLVLSIVAFNVTIESPDVSFLPDDFYSVGLMVVPMWGLYANMLAQLLSQVSSHFIIHYHRRIVSTAALELERSPPDARTTATMHSESSSGSSVVVGTASSDDSEKERLCEHEFARPHRGQSDKLHVRRGVNYGVLFVALSMVVLIVVGCVLPTLSVEVLGILGVAVESGGRFEEEAKTEYNLFSIVKLLMDQAKFLDTAGDYLGLGTLAVLMILSVLVVPMMQSVALLRQWFVPMGRRAHNRTEILIETLSAWQYVEVYLLAVVVSAWQLGPLSEFMINEYCDGLTGTLATLAFYGILDPEDAQCFRVSAEVLEGSFVLIGGAVLLALLNTFVMKALAQYQRDNSESALLYDDPKLSETFEQHWDDEETTEDAASIHPVPVLFTDIFRWMLQRVDLHLSVRYLQDADEESKPGVEDAFPDTPSTAWTEKIGNHPSKESPDTETVTVQADNRTRVAVGIAVGLPVAVSSSGDRSDCFEDSDGSSDVVDSEVSSDIFFD